MAIGDVIKLGTFYIGNDKCLNPQNPVWNGDIPDLTKYNKKNIEIRDTDFDDNYKIKWIQVDTNLLICDRNILGLVTWDGLNKMGYINGRKIIIDKKMYLCRLIDSVEWDKYISDDNTIWHWSDMSTLCREITKEGFSISRGLQYKSKSTNISKDVEYNTVGYRPVLQKIKFKKYLIKQTNQYYSLKSSFYELGQPKDNDEKEAFYKENGIDDLNALVEKKNSKSVDLKLDKNDIYKTIIPINFNEIINKIEYIDEDNKKEIKYNTEEYQLLDLVKKEIGSKFQIGKLEEK